MSLNIYKIAIRHRSSSLFSRTNRAISNLIAVDDRTFEQRLPLKVPNEARGVNLLHDPLWNKGTAHTESERERLGLRGLLPPRIMSMDQQVR